MRMRSQPLDYVDEMREWDERAKVKRMFRTIGFYCFGFVALVGLVWVWGSWR